MKTSGLSLRALFTSSVAIAACSQTVIGCSSGSRSSSQESTAAPASAAISFPDHYYRCVAAGEPRKTCFQVAVQYGEKLDSSDRIVSKAAAASYEGEGPSPTAEPMLRPTSKPTLTPTPKPTLAPSHIPEPPNTRTISDVNDPQTASPMKLCFPTRDELKNWQIFEAEHPSVQGDDSDAKYDYVNDTEHELYALSPGDKVRVLTRYGDDQTIVKVYIVPDKSAPFEGDNKTCFVVDDGHLFSGEQ